MICPTCRKMIPDDSIRCPSCGTEFTSNVHAEREIKKRHYQRWIFYGIFSLVFIGMTAFIVRIYNANTKLINDMNKAQALADEAKKNITQKEIELGGLKTSLSETDKKYQESVAKLTDAQKNLEKKDIEFRKVLDEKSQLDNEKKQFVLEINSADANIYSLVIKLGRPMSNADLKRIPIADANLEGDDGDGDGLSTMVEEAVGTDPKKNDSDGDTFNDKDELMGGYNPDGAGKLPLDKRFAENNKGNILLQVEGFGEAWYVSGDGKRYFLGRPADAFRMMRSLEFWTKDYKAPVVQKDTSTSTQSSLAPVSTTTPTSIP